MNKFAKLAAAALLAGVIAPASASAAVLDAADIHAGWRFSDISSPYKSYGNSTVGAGLEYSNVNVDGVIFFDINLADTSITVNFRPSAASLNLASFNGLFITDLASLFPALSVSSVVASGISFLDSDVIFTADGFGLNFQGDSFENGGSVTVNFASSTAAVPLPAAMPLLLAGLGAIGALRLRRKTA